MKLADFEALEADHEGSHLAQVPHGYAHCYVDDAYGVV